jgi:hypothetical protein
MISVKHGLSEGSKAQQTFMISISSGGQSGGTEPKFGLLFSIVTCFIMAIGVES